jgi:hypothetical protein
MKTLTTLTPIKSQLLGKLQSLNHPFVYLLSVQVAVIALYTTHVMSIVSGQLP